MARNLRHPAARIWGVAWLPVTAWVTISIADPLPVWAAATTGPYKGVALDSAQKATVGKALDQISGLGSVIPGRGGRFLLHVSHCLFQAWIEGRICAEAGSTSDLGVCLPEDPVRCAWTGDRINIQPTMISATPDTFAMLMGVLVHEGTHALQWPAPNPPPPPPGVPTTPTPEWAPLSWEVYTLTVLLREGNLTPAESTNVAARIRFLQWRANAECDASLTQEERAKKIGECANQKSSTEEPKRNYLQEPGESSRIRVDDVSGSFQIVTPFDRTFDFAVATDATGRDLLMVCGVDPGGVSGGVAVYHDATGDGLVDPFTETVLAPLGQPIGIAFLPADGPLPARLFVLDLATREVRLAYGDPMGRPSSLEPIPYATPGMFPVLADLVSLRPGASNPFTGQSVFAWASRQERDYVWPDDPEHELIDVNLDGVADVAAALDRQGSIAELVPALLSDPQHGDLAVRADCLSGRMLKIHVTDSAAAVLGELLGERFIQPQEKAKEVTVPLMRPLVAGEYIVAVDDATGEHETAGSRVNAVRPEILSMDKPEYLPDEEIHLFGRHFTPASQVELSGFAEPTSFVSDSHLVLIAPNRTLFPNNLMAAQIVDGGDSSTIAGIYVAPDCNRNGIDDVIDITAGASSDSNGDGAPDECNLAAVGPQAARRGGLDLAYPNPFRSGTAIAYRLERPGDVELAIYDLRGARVMRLDRGSRTAGRHTARWSGDDERGRRAPAGVYFCRLSFKGAGAWSATRRLVRLR